METSAPAASARCLTLWQGALLFLVACALFVGINYRAYGGYFQADDLDTLGWTPLQTWRDYVGPFFSWRVDPNNFRPIGHAYYRLLEHWAGLNFPRWLAALQSIHLLAVLTLWFLLRRLRFGLWAAGTGCLLFGFHPALFDGYWKPMFVFDVTCGLFCLLSILCYVSDRWILSLVCFFTAFRCKEVAIMLPLALAAYEFFVGGRRWRRLVPFFLISLGLGVQGLMLNRGARANSEYALKLTPAVLWQTSRYYAKYAFLLSWSGVWVLALALWSKDRRAYFGFLSFWCLLFPLLMLPGRMLSVYLYVPLFGMAVLLAAAVERTGWIAAAVFAVAWLPVSLQKLSHYQQRELPIAENTRRYVTDLRAWLRGHPATHSYRYRELPDGMNWWAVPGALAYLTHQPDLDVAREGSVAPSDRAITILEWDPHTRHLVPTVHQVAAPVQAYVKIDGAAPRGQLLSGWYGFEGAICWTMPVAEARLSRPPGAASFRAVFVMPGVVFEQGNHPVLQVFLNDVPLPPYTIRSGEQQQEWRVPSALSGDVRARFVVTPPVRVSSDPRPLGIAMESFGFVGGTPSP